MDPLNIEKKVPLPLEFNNGKDADAACVGQATPITSTVHDISITLGVKSLTKTEDRSVRER